MNEGRVGRARRRSRVYTMWTAAIVALLLGCGEGGLAQTRPTIDADPAMVKGPPTAPVTIVEFSDYQ